MLFPNAGLSVNFIDSLLYIIAFVMALFVAMPFHEFAHAAAAKREGDYTAVALKRYTLAFHRHFDWKGFLFLLLFRFGWAKPVPIDERNFKRGRKSKFLVSIAGILANLILGTIFIFIYMALLKFVPGVFEISYYGDLLIYFLSSSISLNFMLAFMNLLPIYPLDGYKIIESCCKYDNAFLRFMKQHSFLIFILISLTGVYNYYFMFTGQMLIMYIMKLFGWILGI